MFSVPLYKPFLPDDVIGHIAAVLRSGCIASGAYVDKFEKLFGEYLGNPLVTVNGDISTAITLCLFEAGVGPGDDVIMSPLVCLSASCPVRNLFANVCWCDVDPMTGNISPDDIPNRITARTKAILVYHWAGNPASLDEIHTVAKRYGIPVIEDAGEALGAEYKGKRIGNTGSDYTVFSFYPNRHLTTIEGGAIALTNERNFERIKWLKRYGIHQPTFRDDFGEINPASNIMLAGWNSYMSNVAGAIGVEQISKLDHIVSRHRGNGLFYDQALAGVPGIALMERPINSSSSYWVYTFLARDRDTLLLRLKSAGVQASKVHIRNDVYSCFGAGKAVLPGVDHFSAHSISIPCGWWVTDEERARIVDLIRQAG